MEGIIPPKAERTDKPSGRSRWASASRSRGWFSFVCGCRSLHGSTSATSGLAHSLRAFMVRRKWNPEKTETEPPNRNWESSKLKTGVQFLLSRFQLSAFSDWGATAFWNTQSHEL